MQDIPTAMSLEKFLLPTDEWMREDHPWRSIVPRDKIDLIDEAMDERFSVGVAYHPDWGYALLGTGQGPFVIWSEFNLEEYAKCKE